jgi:single-strand DNA-binding protein
MAEGVNKVILVGTLGFDPDHRVVSTGQAKATLRLVTNESWFDKASGQRKEIAEWHRVVVWGKTADLVKQYLQKGRQVFVEGRLRSRDWEKDGQKRTTTEVVANRVVFLGGRGEGPPATAREDRPAHGGGPGRDYSGPDEPAAEPAFQEFSDVGGDDDVPF